MNLNKIVGNFMTRINPLKKIFFTVGWVGGRSKTCCLCVIRVIVLGGWGGSKVLGGWVGGWVGRGSTLVALFTCTVFTEMFFQLEYYMSIGYKRADIIKVPNFLFQILSSKIRCVTYPRE